jgi:hypothetical protein
VKDKYGLDAAMDILVVDVGSSDYLVNTVHDQAKVIQLFEEIRTLLLQQNLAIRLVFLMHIIDQFSRRL